MRRPQPWHDEARRLRAEGLTYREIAEAVDRHLNTVSEFFNPGLHERAQAHLRDRYANDPEFRARRREAWRHQPNKKLYRLRTQARDEARVRGCAPEEIFRLWECEL